MNEKIIEGIAVAALSVLFVTALVAKIRRGDSTPVFETDPFEHGGSSHYYRRRMYNTMTEQICDMRARARASSSRMVYSNLAAAQAAANNFLHTGRDRYVSQFNSAMESAEFFV